MEFRNRLGEKEIYIHIQWISEGHLTLVYFPSTQPTPKKKVGGSPQLPVPFNQTSQQNMAKHPLPPTWKWNHVKKIPYFHKPESSQWLNPPTPLKNMRKSKWVHLPPCVGVKIPKICVKQTSTQRIFPWTHAFFSGWWFQPLWKILVKLEIFPK